MEQLAPHDLHPKEWLKAARVAAGLTQRELGKRLGVHSATISEWETGKARPRGHLLAALEAILPPPVSAPTTSTGTIVYALCDPRTGEIRYIGSTRRSLALRLQCHIRRGSRNDHSRMGRWIADLACDDQVPVIIAIEENENASRAPFWVSEYRKRGADLLNLDAETGAQDRQNAPGDHCACCRDEERLFVYQTASDEPLFLCKRCRGALLQDFIHREPAPLLALRLTRVSKARREAEEAP